MEARKKWHYIPLLQLLLLLQGNEEERLRDQNAVQLFLATDVTILRFAVKAWKGPDEGKQFEATKFTAHVVQHTE
jgi:hypothetical protein